MSGTAGCSGRLPKPTALKELAGNPGHRPLNPQEIRFTPLKGATAPEWFVTAQLPLATQMWQVTSKELTNKGVLCITDLAVLERWCVAYELWRRAVCHVAKEGAVLTHPNGATIKNPQLTVKKEQESEMNATGSRLGLDPSSRSRLVGMAALEQPQSDNLFLQVARDPA